MQENLEKLIKIVYKKWKLDQPKPEQLHPDEETFACFLEGRLPPKENERIRAHLISCECCAEAFAVSSKLEVIENQVAPEQLVQEAKRLIKEEDWLSILEIGLRFKEKAIEIMNTTGDILVGQEFVPAPVLRSRKAKDFKDEVTILKDFKDIRVEVKIENKGSQAFDLTVLVKDKESQKIIKDLRVTLLRQDLELESYLNDFGKVIFENVLLGKYTVEISTLESKLASVLLEIKT
jgi:hypothetical protein